MNDYCKGREEFTTDEWLDLLLRSLGMEPSMFDKRKKLLFITRLIPFVETNFNLVELGPRGTGKSFFFRKEEPDFQQNHLIVPASCYPLHLF